MPWILKNPTLIHNLGDITAITVLESALYYTVINGSSMERENVSIEKWKKIIK